jgi:prepilin-type N-terminal cleavage/methylation domain-containing protein
MAPSLDNAKGFSLLEVLVAIGLIAGALSALAQLLAISVHANIGAETATTAVILAAQKMEQLRGEATAVVVGGSLQADTAGFVDFLDAGGRPVAGAGDAGVSFVRRWAIEPAPFDAAQSRVLRVRVFRVLGRASTAPPWPATGLDEVRLLSVIAGRER